MVSEQCRWNFAMDAKTAWRSKCVTSVTLYECGQVLRQKRRLLRYIYQNGSILWNEEAQELEIERVRNHYELECWIKPTKVSRVVGPSVCTGKYERHRVAIPRRADHETPKELHTQGADVPRVCEGSMKGSTILPEESQIRCEDKSEKHNCKDEIEKDEIEKHNLQIPRHCPLTKHRTHSKKWLPSTKKTGSIYSSVIWFSHWYAARTTTLRSYDRNLQEHKSRLGISSLASEQEGEQERSVLISPIHWTISHGEFSFVALFDCTMRKTTSASDCTMNFEHPSSDNHERIQTIRNQIKSYKIQSEKNPRITIKDDSSLLTWLSRHAAWQYMRFRKHQDSTTVYENIGHILLVEGEVACMRPRAWVSKTWISMVGRYLVRKWKQDEWTFDRNVEWHGSLQYAETKSEKTALGHQFPERDEDSNSNSESTHQMLKRPRRERQRHILKKEHVYDCLKQKPKSTTSAIGENNIISWNDFSDDNNIFSKILIEHMVLGVDKDFESPTQIRRSAAAEF